MNEYLTMLDALDIHLNRVLVVGVYLLLVCVTAVVGLLKEEDTKRLQIGVICCKLDQCVGEHSLSLYYIRVSGFYILFLLFYSSAKCHR